MKLPYEAKTNRELYETLKAKAGKGFAETWPIVGEMARRLRRLQELLRNAEDYGMGSPENMEMVNGIVADFSTYKLNGAGDERK